MAVLVHFKLKPSTTRRNKLNMMRLDSVIHFFGEINTRRSNKLRNNYALGTVDYKGTAIGHEREISHKHELLLHFARFFIDKANVYKKRSLIRNIFSSTLGNGVWWITKLMSTKGHLHCFSRVLYRRKLHERLSKTIGHESCKGLFLHRD